MLGLGMHQRSGIQLNWGKYSGEKWVTHCVLLLSDQQKKERENRLFTHSSQNQSCESVENWNSMQQHDIFRGTLPPTHFYLNAVSAYDKMRTDMDMFICWFSCPYCWHQSWFEVARCWQFQGCSNRPGDHWRNWEFPGQALAGVARFCPSWPQKGLQGPQFLPLLSKSQLLGSWGWSGTVRPSPSRPKQRPRRRSISRPDRTPEPSLFPENKAYYGTL